MKKSNYVWLAILLVGSIWAIMRNNERINAPFQKESGMIFGTIYEITYQNDRSLRKEIDDELLRFDASLSMFNDTSVISRINRSEDIIPDTLFMNVFHKAMEISAATGGAFDITVAPLVNAWGFGWKGGEMPTKEVVDSLLEIIGYQKLSLDKDGRIIKRDERMSLDCSAIAKGYAVDVIAGLLEKYGVKNYMVNIGGEVDLKGHNPQGGDWRIGINRPIEDSLSTSVNELQVILSLTGKGIATSGNYRNFYYKDGKRYAHTINPKSGYPIEHELLSATVISDDCMTSDAYATSFMVMGKEKAQEILAAHPEMEAYFILSAEDGSYDTWSTEGLKRYILDENP